MHYAKKKEMWMYFAGQTAHHPVLFSHIQTNALGKGEGEGGAGCGDGYSNGDNTQSDEECDGRL